MTAAEIIGIVPVGVTIHIELTSPTTGGADFNGEVVENVGDKILRVKLSNGITRNINVDQIAWFV